jgi:hypothetical protein
MSDNLTFAELEAQRVELLPPRTVLSLISLSGRGNNGTPGQAGTAHQGVDLSPPTSGLPSWFIINATAGHATGGAPG